MNSQKKQQQYSSEFKELAVKLTIESDQPVTKTAEELGVNKNTLHTWISKYQHPQGRIASQVEEVHIMMC